MAESRLRRWYGASPWHLLALVANLAVVAYVGTRLAGATRVVEILAWFAVSVVFFDFIVLPAALAADWTLDRLAGRGHPAVPWRNHVRVPLLLAALLLLVAWPLVLRVRAGTYLGASGLPVDPYRGRWLAVAAALVLVSAAAYGVRRITRPRRPGGAGTNGTGPAR